MSDFHYINKFHKEIAVMQAVEERAKKDPKWAKDFIKNLVQEVDNKMKSD